MSSHARKPSKGYLLELGPSGDGPDSENDGWIRLSGDGWRVEASSADLVYMSQGGGVVGTARLNPSSLPTSIARNHHRTQPRALIAELVHDRPADFVDRLEGDFSIVILNGGSVTAVRDHMGVHGLFYAQHGERVGIASHLRLLLGLHWVDSSLDETRIGDYLLSLFEDGESSFYRHVRQVPAGHMLRFSNGRLAIERYWSLDSEHEFRCESDDRYVDAFREEFLRSVADRAQGDASIGSMLSGGLDSSSVAVGARLARYGERLHVFSGLVAEGDPGDERSFIDAVARSGGMIPHRVAIDRLAPFGSLEGELGVFDEPVFAPNLFVHRALMDEAQRVGCSVLLDGLDGDTAVSHGLGRLVELARGVRLLTLGHEIRGLSRGVLGRHPTSILWRSVVRPLVLRPLRLALRTLRSRPAEPWGEEAHVSHDFAHALHLPSRYLELSESRVRPHRTQREEQIARITWPLHQHLLQMLAQLSGAFGLESRYPFYDKRLIELAVALPSAMKLRDGWTRYVLRRAMSTLLPSEVAWRVGKSDLGPNFCSAFRYGDLWRLETLLRSTKHDVWHYVDIDRTRQATMRLINGRDSEVFPLWKTLTLAAWLKRNNV